MTPRDIRWPWTASDLDVGPACSFVDVPPTVVTDASFRDVYSQGYRHAVADGRRVIADLTRALLQTAFAVCPWTYAQTSDVATGCGQTFVLLDDCDGIPSSFKFCAFCGKPIRAVNTTDHVEDIVDG